MKYIMKKDKLWWFKILWIIIACVLFWFIVVMFFVFIHQQKQSEVAEAHNIKTEYYTIGGSISEWNNLRYILRKEGSYSQNDSVELSVTEYSWLEKVAKYKDYLLFQLSFDNWKLNSYRILKRKNWEEIWDIESVDWVGLIWEDLTRLSELQMWEETTVEWHKFIYNDTNKIQDISVKYWWGENYSIEIQPWELYYNEDPLAIIISF